MTSEYELGCATCGESLTRTEVPGEVLGLATDESVEVAECRNCGERYFPETTLERLGGRGRAQPSETGGGERATEERDAGRPDDGSVRP